MRCDQWTPSRSRAERRHRHTARSAQLRGARRVAASFNWCLQPTRVFARAAEAGVSRTSVRRCCTRAARATLSTSRAVVEVIRRSGRTLPPRFAARGPAAPAAPRCIATRGASTSQPPAPASKLPPRRTPPAHPRLSRSSPASSSAATEHRQVSPRRYRLDDAPPRRFWRSKPTTDRAAWPLPPTSRAFLTPPPDRCTGSCAASPHRSGGGTRELQSLSASLRRRRYNVQQVPRVRIVKGSSAKTRPLTIRSRGTIRRSAATTE